MSKPASRLVSLTLVLVLFITPMAVLADHDPAVLHGTVFDDADQNGIFNDGVESGISGVIVDLFVDGESTPIQTTTTASDGSYEFLGLGDGDYTVSVADIIGKVDSNPNPVNFSVDDTTNIPIVDFGKVLIEQLGSISGTVYDDLDRSGDVSTGDVGIGSVELRILDEVGSEIATTPTVSNGDYIFEELFAGDYTVVETDPPLYYSITPNQQLVTLAVNEDKTDIDFFDFIPADGEVPKLDLLLMKFFDISLLEFQALRAMEGWGYGNIAKAYFLAQLSGESIDGIVALRETMGWGNVMKLVLGRAGLKGYNLGLIVSGREIPNSTQKLIDSCEIITTPEEVQELYSSGASTGAIKKACKLALEVGGDYVTLVEALGLLGTHNQKQVREILSSETANQITNGNHSPPPCKGKNKHDEGCS